MTKLDEAKAFLKEIGMPERQQNDMCAYTLLALAGIKPNGTWETASNEWIRIHDILMFIKQFHERTYAENSRETVRKRCIHPFRNAAVIEDHNLVTNSPNYSYRITTETLALIQCYGSASFPQKLRSYKKRHTSLIEKYANKRRMTMLPVTINSQTLLFSTGKHNELQKAILEKFATLFVAPDCQCVYVGDTTKKDLVKNVELLDQLGFEITLHDKMPDVILYSADKHWLYFIEAVISSGPMSPQRILDLQKMTASVTAGKIFVTAFPDIATYKKHSSELAWETEVWLADFPDHMIHLNGDKFLGPRS